MIVIRVLRVLRIARIFVSWFNTIFDSLLETCEIQHRIAGVRLVFFSDNNDLDF
jgi:hypothetical protein